MTTTPSPAAVPRMVISEPGKEVMGGGKNAKWVKSERGGSDGSRADALWLHGPHGAGCAKL